MNGRRVLVANIRLADGSGTEMYTFDLARSLLEAGLRPMVYSPTLGPLAARVEACGIPVVDRIERLAVTPDIIQGHHALETMTALLQFPTVPGIFVCHDAFTWHSRPPHFPRILQYVAVDEACRDRLSCGENIAEERTTIIPNGIDLDRFRPREVPLPPRPRRGLVMSNYVDRPTLEIVAKACRAHGITLDGAGRCLEQSWEQPENHLGLYDLVFAKGRCAWEALAVGAAVVVCDQAGSGPMVTTSRLDGLAAVNFGRRAIRGPLDPRRLRDEIARYDAEDAARVSERVRQIADVRLVTARLIALYDQVITKATSINDATINPGLATTAELHAAAIFLQECSFPRKRPPDPAAAGKKEATNPRKPLRIRERIASIFRRSPGKAT